MSLIVPSDNPDTSTIPDHEPEAPRPDEGAEQSAVVDEKKSNWKSAASATAKLLLRGVRDSADAFGPLKAVAGGLCFVLENYEVLLPYHVHYPQCLQVLQRTKANTQANTQAVTLLVPRVKALSTLLCMPVSEGDAQELARRKELGQ